MTLSAMVKIISTSGIFIAVFISFVVSTPRQHRLDFLSNLSGGVYSGSKARATYKGVNIRSTPAPQEDTASTPYPADFPTYSPDAMKSRPAPKVQESSSLGSSSSLFDSMSQSKGQFNPMDINTWDSIPAAFFAPATPAVDGEAANKGGARNSPLPFSDAGAEPSLSWDYSSAGLGGGAEIRTSNSQDVYLPLADHSPGSIVADQPVLVSDWSVPPVGKDTAKYREEPTASPASKRFSDGESLAKAILTGKVKKWEWSYSTSLGAGLLSSGRGDRSDDVTCCQRLPYICGVDGMCVIGMDECKDFCACAANPQMPHCIKIIPRIKSTMAELEKKILAKVAKQLNMTAPSFVETPSSVRPVTSDVINPTIRETVKHTTVEELMLMAMDMPTRKPTAGLIQPSLWTQSWRSPFVYTSHTPAPQSRSLASEYQFSEFLPNVKPALQSAGTIGAATGLRRQNTGSATKPKELFATPAPGSVRTIINSNRAIQKIPSPKFAADNFHFETVTHSSAPTLSPKTSVYREQTMHAQITPSPESSKLPSTQDQDIIRPKESISLSATTLDFKDVTLSSRHNIDGARSNNGFSKTATTVTHAAAHSHDITRNNKFTIANTSRDINGPGTEPAIRFEATTDSQKTAKKMDAINVSNNAIRTTVNSTNYYLDMIDRTYIDTSSRGIVTTVEITSIGSKNIHHIPGTDNDKGELSSTIDDTTIKGNSTTTGVTTMSTTSVGFDNSFTKIGQRGYIYGSDQSGNKDLTNALDLSTRQLTLTSSILTTATGELAISTAPSLQLSTQPISIEKLNMPISTLSEDTAFTKNSDFTATTSPVASHNSREGPTTTVAVVSSRPKHFPSSAHPVDIPDSKQPTSSSDDYLPFTLGFKSSTDKSVSNIPAESTINVTVRTETTGGAAVDRETTHTDTDRGTSDKYSVVKETSDTAPVDTEGNSTATVDKDSNGTATAGKETTGVITEVIYTNSTTTVASETNDKAAAAKETSSAPNKEKKTVGTLTAGTYIPGAETYQTATSSIETTRRSILNTEITGTNIYGTTTVGIETTGTATVVTNTTGAVNVVTETNGTTTVGIETTGTATVVTNTTGAVNVLKETNGTTTVGIETTGTATVVTNTTGAVNVVTETTGTTTANTGATSTSTSEIETNGMVTAGAAALDTGTTGAMKIVTKTYRTAIPATETTTTVKTDTGTTGMVTAGIATADTDTTGTMNKVTKANRTATPVTETTTTAKTDTTVIVTVGIATADTDISGTVKIFTEAYGATTIGTETIPRAKAHTETTGMATFGTATADTDSTGTSRKVASITGRTNITTADTATTDVVTYYAATVDTATTDVVTYDAATVDTDSTGTSRKVTTTTEMTSITTVDTATTDVVTYDAATVDTATTDVVTYDTATVDTATTDVVTYDAATVDTGTSRTASKDTETADTSSFNAEMTTLDQFVATTPIDYNTRAVSNLSTLNMTTRAASIVTTANISFHSLLPPSTDPPRSPADNYQTTRPSNTEHLNGQFTEDVGNVSSKEYPLDNNGTTGTVLGTIGTQNLSDLVSSGQDGNTIPWVDKTGAGYGTFAHNDTGINDNIVEHKSGTLTSPSYIEDRKMCGSGCFREVGGVCVVGNDRKPHCVVVRDTCDKILCINGHCVSTDGLQVCECRSGWVGMFCEKSCDLDCGDRSFCAANEDSKNVTCTCRWNFTGQRCENIRKIVHVIVDLPEPKEGLETWEVAVVAAVTAVILALLSVLSPYLLWKNQWLPMRKCVFYFWPYEDSNDEEFDAFISYKSTPRDERFVLQHLYPKLERELDFRLCLPFRDFIPGESLTKNVVRAINKSRRVILILSPSYVSSEWCRYENQVVHKELLKCRSKVISIVLEDNTGMLELDNTLKKITDTFNLFRWPGEEKSSSSTNITTFWKLLELSMPKRKQEYSSSDGSSSSRIYCNDFSPTALSKSSFNSIVSSLTEEDIFASSIRREGNSATDSGNYSAKTSFDKPKRSSLGQLHFPEMPWSQLGVISTRSPKESRGSITGSDDTGIEIITKSSSVSSDTKVRSVTASRSTDTANVNLNGAPEMIKYPYPTKDDHILNIYEQGPRSGRVICQPASRTFPV